MHSEIFSISLLVKISSMHVVFFRQSHCVIPTRHIHPEIDVSPRDRGFRKMARFVRFSYDDIKRFNEENENENTKRKTFYDTKVFLDFLEVEGEQRKIEEIPPNVLKNLAAKFVLSVRKKNGEEYEPSSLRAFLQSIDRHLRKNGYPASILNDKEFSEVQDILKKKKKHLKSLGKGNKPNSADPLTDEEIEQLFSEGVLGSSTPRSLLNTVWLNNCIFFGMRPGKEQRDLCWGDLELKLDSQGVRYIEFSTERQTKTRTGENPRNVRETKPKMFENPDNLERCPFAAFLCYKEHRPAHRLDENSPFYLAINTEIPKIGKSWYKNSPLGVNSLRSMMKNMVNASSKLHATNRKLVNHSTRKHLVQKLVNNNVPPTEIAQITGHKNINSINNYSTVSVQKQQHISAILSGASTSKQDTSQIMAVDELCQSEKKSIPSLPTFQNCHIGTINIYSTQNQDLQGEIRTTKRRRVILTSDSEGSQ